MSNNKNKTITVRISEDELNDLHKYTKLTKNGMYSQQMFIREAIKEKIERVELEEVRCGKYIPFENLMNENIDKYEIKKDIQSFLNCYKELVGRDSKLSFSLMKIIDCLNDLYHK